MYGGRQGSKTDSKHVRIYAGGYDIDNRPCTCEILVREDRAPHACGRPTDFVTIETGLLLFKRIRGVTVHT